MRESDTREKLLDSAERLFAEKGFESVSIRDIASDADANVAAVNYHFQGKNNLYAAVLERRLSPKRDKFLATIKQVTAAGDGVPDLEELIGSFIRIHLEDALFLPGGEAALPLIARELHESRIGGAPVCSVFIAPVHAALGEAMALARPGLDEDTVRWVIGSLIGQIVHFVMRWKRMRSTAAAGDEGAASHRRMFPVLSGSLEDYISRTVEHITRFSIGGIEKMTQNKEKE